MTNVRRLPRPSGLGYGNEPRQAFTTSSSRNSTSPAYLSISRPGSSSEKLPSVSQLLISGSPAAPGASTFPPRPEYQLASGHPSPNGHAIQNRSPYATSDYNSSSYASTYQTTPSPVSHPYGAPNGSLHAAPRPSSSSYYPPEHPHPAPPHPGLPGLPGGLGSDDASRPVVKLIGERVFPGEGVCFVYDDGSHVRKVIDGEQVNAQWGVTKAGKPRKRLAIACVTCREKKIKCDPAEPKCVQCDKADRECRFQTA